ncbi:MAG TPA: NAD-dependent epimerase/dehydratase family protein [Parvularculaceae bacterium]|nr:NAD-dependent epimerase/dehydratase family protein [Parvularculaceae bacterium]
MKRIFVTGAAGFIGFYVSRALLARGLDVVGVDDMNDYYPRALKSARLDMLRAEPGFSFHEVDIADHARLAALPGLADIDGIIHLAAQAGVRYSLENPFVYASSNLVGHLSILELARHAKKRPLLVYASSSSVYGTNTKVPYSEGDPVNQPVSLYAATKRADELMSECYARLYGLPSIGLRFFTVYGPWGRPDMAYWLFTEKMLAREPIRVFNHGDLKRDFTYIDDIVEGVLAVALGKPNFAGPAPHRIYNIGNNRPVDLMKFIAVLEAATREKAIMQFEPMQAGDVYETCADIDAIRRDYGFEPKTTLETGIPKFIDWYKDYRKKAGA